MNRRENILRAVRFEQPETIPMQFSVNSACWERYPRSALEDLMESHRLLFPGFKPSSAKTPPRPAPWRIAGRPYTDSWGCVWETSQTGITGAVTEHPLASWDAFADFAAPDPDATDGWGPVDWERIAQNLGRIRRGGGLTIGSLRHGHTFLTLTYLRGYEGLILDMADGEPRLRRLIDMVEEFNLQVMQHYIGLRVEVMAFPEDLGMQKGPMLSPRHFREYIKPVYRNLMAPARASGCIIHMHSDGDIHELVDDLLEGGVQVLNLQDLVNGIDWIRDRLAGRICIDLDIDRQAVTRFGTPGRIDALIREEVVKLGSRKGGLMMRYGLYPGVPLENVRALMDAMERYAGHYS
ncbi:MAG: hypothetical protein GXP31_18155 [Kiritimatiellaeota bacterium]|nr:hypothetical protein [Kiritimatiellota bacterium]